MATRNSKSIMVFAENKRSVDKVCEALREAEIKSLPFYADLSVFGRILTLMLFKTHQLPVLVTTNICARGLDTMDLSHVIQFDFAKTSLDYFQRVGRVGRMGQRGSLVTNFIRYPSDMQLAK